jgi:hypothetical protein
MIPEEDVLRYFQFIKNRHAIYLRRQRGDAWPWTSDKILQTYKFTNIFRELDTGTIHCRTALREPYANHKELFFNIASYRLYNFIDTQKEIGYITKYDPFHTMDIMYARQARGERVFTGAHMITGTLGGSKIQQVFGLCMHTLWNNRRVLEPQPGDTLEIAYNRLNKHSPGYGPFISYEVISDLRWTRYLQHASDILTWANPGPGCKRGINRLLGNKVRRTTAADRAKYPKGDNEYIKYMRYLLFRSKDLLPKWVPAMEMRDIEHSLCEYDKYERVRLGEGKPRSRYKPPVTS